MGAFPPAGCIVAICRDEHAQPVGAGFVVGEHHVLTAAHVVTPASHVESTDDLQVFIEWPWVKGGGRVRASVEVIRPLGAERTGDFAVLRLHEAGLPADMCPAPISRQPGHVGEVMVYGFPAGQPQGVWAEGRLLGQSGLEWRQLNVTDATAYDIEKGFSGAAVWDVTHQTVVGIVVAKERKTDTRVGFAVSLDAVEDAWPPLEALLRNEPLVRARARAVAGDTSRLSRQAARLFARAVTDSHLLDDVDDRRRVLRALDEIRPWPEATRAEAETEIARQAGSHRAESVFRALLGVTDADDHRLTLLGKRWRTLEMVSAPLERLGGNVTPSDIRRAALLTLPYDGDDWTQAPIEELGEALCRAAELGESVLEARANAGGKPPLHELVVRLENRRDDVHVDDSWFVDGPGPQLDQGELDHLRRTVTRDEPVRLVFDLWNHANERGGWPSSMKVFLGARAFTVRIVADEDISGSAWSPSDDEIRAAVERVVSDAQAVADDVEIGFILSRSRLAARPELWTYLDVWDEPRPLGGDFVTVLHCGERFHASSRAKLHPPWLDRVRTDNRSVIGVAWVRGEQATRAEIERLSRGGTVIGLGFTPVDAPRSRGQDHLLDAVAAGAPYVLWTEPEALDDHGMQWIEDRLSQITDVGQCPRVLHDEWAEQADARRVRLLWDGAHLKRILNQANTVKPKEPVP